MERLERLLKELARRRVGASGGVLEQRRALAACEETYLLVARAAEALLRLGGEQELARRLRPKVKRKPRRPAIVRVAVSWWPAVVAVFRRLRGFVAGRVETVANWTVFQKTRILRLARGLPKAPNV